jgi:glycosyltransferase involved in cell wall biosynthesis
LAESALALGWQVMVIDDGSSDATTACLHDLPLALLRHELNRGKAASLRTAFRHALAHGAAAVVTIDGDGQHDPGDAPRLLAAWRDRPECLVIGARLHDRSSIPRALPREPLRLLLDLLGRQPPDRRFAIRLSRLLRSGDADRAERAGARQALHVRARS